MKTSAILTLAVASLATAESLHYASGAFSAHHTAMATTVHEVEQYNNAGPTHLASSGGSSDSYSESCVAVLPVDALQSAVGMVPYPAPTDYAFEGTHEGTPFSKGYFQDMEDSMQRYKGKLANAQDVVEDDGFAARPSVTPSGLTGKNLERLNGPFLADSDVEGGINSEYPYNLGATGEGQVSDPIPGYANFGFSGGYAPPVEGSLYASAYPSDPDVYGYSYDHEEASEAGSVYYSTRTVLPPSSNPSYADVYPSVSSPAHGSGVFVAQTEYPVSVTSSTGVPRVTVTSRFQEVSSPFETDDGLNAQFSSSTSGYPSLQTGDAGSRSAPSNVTNPTVGAPVGEDGRFVSAAGSVVSSSAALALAAAIGALALL